MKLNDVAKEVLKDRYVLKDKEGNPIEDIENIFPRVAHAVAIGDTAFNDKADIKKIEKKFLKMMENLDFLPNSPCLMNAGTKIGQLSACFVLPVEDSMEEIFQSVKDAALIHKSGGGTGFNFSKLRQQGAKVASTGGESSGPISFMEVFNAATGAVAQGGKRRGANMGMLRVDHPDILDFIECKGDKTKFTNFNISIALTEEFMEAVEKDGEYSLIEPHTNEVVGSLNAKEVFNKIVDFAWKNGEPGIMFLDRVNRDNPVPSQGLIESTNPCGEQPLLGYESCTLGSINLANFVTKNALGMKDVDWDRLREVTETAIHFLDNVVEVNNFPLEKIKEMTQSTRKVGLGIMGFADMLNKMGIRYGSESSFNLAENVMRFIQESAKEASSKLAETRGNFPLYDESIYKGDRPMRNATVTTIAPTGTISMIADCSSGMEPIFGYVYIKYVLDGKELIIANKVLEETLKERGLYSEELMKKIAEKGSLQEIDEIPEDIKEVFVTAMDITPAEHIRMQAAFQKHIDNAVSKTVNFANEATREDVAEAYMLAYKLGCKGTTIYRDGSRDEQVLNIGKVNKLDDVENAKPQKRERPKVTRGITEKMKIGCGSLFVTVNYDDEGICEVFTSTGKHGGCPSQSEATARLTSVALRSGLSLDEIYNQLKGIRCPSTIRQDGMDCTSCPDAIARVLKKVSEEIENRPTEPVKKESAETPTISGDVCPECGSTLLHEGGCNICHNCGYSKCG